MDCNTIWVPHPRDAFVFVARVGVKTDLAIRIKRTRDAFVFVARVGEHVANLLGRINKASANYIPWLKVKMHYVCVPAASAVSRSATASTICSWTSSMVRSPSIRMTRCGSRAAISRYFRQTRP